MRKFLAFTLAEVLITLGIIGVVASLTLPALTQSYSTKIVETRLQKFYSMINQAVVRAEADYGDRQYWYQDTNSIEKDKDGNFVKGSSVAEQWYNKYLGPYIQTIKIEYDEKGLPIFYFADGSALKAIQDSNMRDWLFYVDNPNKCIKKYGTAGKALGKCAFYFIYMPGDSNHTQADYGYSWRHHYRKGFEPYKYAWEGTRETLFSGSYSGCNNTKQAYCTALIQDNGWKIPDDYPFKVSY